MKHIEDVPQISPRDKAILHEIRQTIQRVVPGTTVYLYGSAARGTREPDSDLDVLLLTERPLSRAEQSAVADAVYELELARGIVVSTIQYEKAEWDAPLTCASPFRMQVEAEAVLL
jgi:predicted nucleotidyltransferase